MLPATRHLLPVVGVDIHMIIILGAPVPIPHPFIGLVFDPMDWIPKIGASVRVNGIPRGNSGTEGMLGCKVHIPMGGPFAMAPTIGHNSKNFFGSPRVKAEGSYFSGAGFMVMSCNDIGVPLSITPGKKFKPIPTLYLPTSATIPIPAGKPVIVGGPYVPDLMGMLMGLVMSFGFGALMKVGGGLAKKALTALNKGVLKKFKCTQGLSKKLCKKGFEPVDLVTGRVLYEGVDFEIPGPIPIRWERNWYSDSKYEGLLGHGAHLCYDLTLEIFEEDQTIGVMLPDGRAAGFPLLLTEAENFYNRTEKLTLTCKGRDQYELFDHNSQLAYAFERMHGSLFKPRRLSNRAGLFIEFFYDQQYRLNRIVDTAGREILISLDVFNRITRVDARHKGVRRKYIEYGYNEVGDLIAITDALDQTTTIRYQNHLMVEKTDRNGQTFYWEYDGFAAGARCVHTYGDGGLLEGRIEYRKGYNVVTNSLGESKTYHYDENNLCIQETDALGNAVYHQYTDFMEPYRDIDEEGNITGYVYDAKGNLISEQGPDGAMKQYLYDDSGKVKMFTDAEGNATVYVYQDNALSAIVGADGAVTSYEYDEAGLVMSIKNDSGQKTGMEYDEDYNLTKISLPGGSESFWQYDAWGRCSAAINPEKQSQSFQYDLLDRIVRLRKYDGNKVNLRYNAYNDVVYAEDAHRQISFEYTPLGNMKVRQESGARMQFNFNTEGRLTSLVNERGEVYRLKYDKRGKVIQEIGFDGLTHHYIRNRAGKVVKVERPEGRFCLYEYDLAGRLTRTEFSDGSWEVYSYNKNGQLIEATNENGSVIIKRDPAGRIIKEDQDGYTVESRYNANGQRIKKISSLGAFVDIERNVSGFVSCMKASSSEGARWEGRFEYNSLGLETERAVPGGITSVFRYDSTGHATDHKVINSSGVLRHRIYSWNVNDRLRSIMNGITRGTAQYGYDDFGSLVWARYEDDYFEMRIPDEVGNLYKHPDRNDRRYGMGGQLLERGGIHYKYDTAGNLITKTFPNKEQWTYEWGENGMLRKVARPDGKVAAFEYDALGRRTAKIFDGSITRWVWDGDVPLHEWRYPLAERPEIHIDEYGEIVKNKDEPLTGMITWLFDDGTFKPCAKFNEGRTYSILTNYLGTPVEMYDADGGKVWEVEYNIYGEIRAQLSGDACDCPFRYQGQYEDRDVGLYYNRFRYYSAIDGLFISQDPVRLIGGNRPYSYIKDTNWWLDLFGLTGTYMFTDGTTSYIGKGPADRMYTSMGERVGGSSNVTQGLHVDYGDPKVGFMVEAELMSRHNAVTSADFSNEINSPGKKMLDELEKTDKKAYDDIIKKADEFEADYAKTTGIKCK